MSRRIDPLIVVASLAVAAFLGVVNVLWWSPVSHRAHAEGTDFKPSALVATDFVNAMSRMRGGTWKATGVFVRDSGDGSVLTFPMSEARQGDDRRYVVGNTIYVQHGENDWQCTTRAPDGLTDGRLDRSSTPVCRLTGEVPESRAQWVSRIHAFVVGPTRNYDVAYDANRCFVLMHRYGMASKTWGLRATFCFDDATGAPRLQSFYRNGVLDTVRADNVSEHVSNEDIAAPRDAVSSS